MTRRTRLRKAGRIAGYAVAGLVVLALVTVVVAPIYFQGPRFGRLVDSMLPKMQGQVHVGAGHWNWSTVIALVRGRPAPLELEDLTIIDPEGTEVLHVEKVSARIEVHRDPTRIIVHDLIVTDARWRFARMAKKNKVGFLAAFDSIPRPGKRKPSKPTSSSLEITGARLEGVEATFGFPNWGLLLRDAHGVGALALKGSSFTFDVTGVAVRGGGRLRILGEKSGIVLPIDRGHIDRVATTADDPDSIQLDASGVAVGASRITGKGKFTGIYGVTPASKHGGIEYEAHIENAADAANAIAAHRGLGGKVRFGGANADVRMRFKNPFDWVSIDAEARGFAVKSGDIDVRKVGFHLAAEPIQGRIRVERLSLASPDGGRLEAEATLDRLKVEATVNATRFGARTLMPSALRPFASGTLDGQLQARADLLAGDAELVRSTLIVTRDENEKGPRTVALLAGRSSRAPPGATVVRLAGARLVDGVLRLPRLTLSMWGGRLGAEGRVALWDPGERRWMSPPALDLTLTGDRLQIERLIESNFAGGSLTVAARVRGPADDLALDIAFAETSALTVLGERVRLPARASLRVNDGGLSIDTLPLGGPGLSALIVAGRIARSGRLALDVGIRQFPIDHIPGILGTKLPVDGEISGSVRIVGEPRVPALSGDLMFQDIRYGGHALGGGTVKIVPQAKGAVRAHGKLVDTIAVDARLAPKRSGFEGDVTLTLAKVPIEPFLPRLPAKLSARGVASGTAIARVAPHQPATAEGRLTELTLSLTSPPAPGRPSGTFEVRAENEIVVRARADEGLTLGAARLRSSFGVVEVAGESRGDKLRASLRGRLELGGLASFARPWVDRIAGAIDIDLAGSGHGALDDFALNGDIVVAAPVTLKPAKMSIEASVPSGRLRLANNVLATTSTLPVVVRAERFPTAAVSKLDASARISGRLDGGGAHPKFVARIAVDSVDVQVPLVGRKPIRSAGGEIDLAGDLATGKVEITRIDLPIAAEAEAMTLKPGATVDRASVALRVRGNMRQLVLAGDVDVLSAHVRTDALGSSSSSKGAGGASGSGKKGGPLADHPELEAMRLDVRVRAQGGAIKVDIDNFPDLSIDADLRVTGTVKKPSIAGSPKGANFWSSFVLAIAKLFS
jgi:hypothetical protein